MTLYTLQVPNPPAGQDWLTTVPGIYVYDVTGVTATLDTASIDALTIPDASGNGNDGHYHRYNVGGPDFLPGLVVGNAAVNADGPPPTHNVQVQGPAAVADWQHSWCITWWEQTPTFVGSATFYKFTSPNPGTGAGITIFVQVGAGLDYLELQGVANWRSAPGTVPADGNPHFFGVQFDHNTGFASFYLDGVLVPWLVTGTAPSPGTPVTGTFQLGNGAGNAAATLDELAIIRTAFLPAFFADLFSKRGSFAAYNAAVLAVSPRLYYHLAPNPAPTGRTPGLEITDGNNDVALIGDGFAAQATPGPYRYSWQPKQPNDARAADGLLTVVGIPQLILPGGYTIGTRTPDIQPGDQWSDVVVWWDDRYGQAVAGAGSYDYGRGVHLKYHQIGAP